MASRWASFVIWAAVVAGAAFWALRLLVPSTTAPAHTVTVSAAGMARGDLTRVLGADLQPVAAGETPAPVEDRRFQLLGVVAARGVLAGGQGVALIAIDGKPPKAYRVGATVDGDNVLQAVTARGAALGPRGGAAAISLATPPLPLPATGVLPPAVSGAGASPPRPMPPLQRPAAPPPPPPSFPQPVNQTPPAPDDAQAERQSEGTPMR